MKILAIECSTSFGSVAILKDETVLSSLSWQRKKSHGEVLTSSIQHALELAQFRSDEVEGIAVGQGPGSFTGIRVALSAAKSIAYAHNLPVVAIDSLRIMAQNIEPKNSTLVCLQNAFSQLVYFAKYRPSQKSWDEVQAPVAITIKEVVEKVAPGDLVLGDIADVMPEEFIQLHTNTLRELDPSQQFPHAHQLGLLSLQDFRRGHSVAWRELDALYIRVSTAEEKMKKGLLKPVN